LCVIVPDIGDGFRDIVTSKTLTSHILMKKKKKKKKKKRKKGRESKKEERRRKQMTMSEEKQSGEGKKLTKSLFMYSGNFWNQPNTNWKQKTTDGETDRQR
jgi:cell shape-determining protein MreC